MNLLRASASSCLVCKERCTVNNSEADAEVMAGGTGAIESGDHQLPEVSGRFRRLCDLRPNGREEAGNDGRRRRGAGVDREHARSGEMCIAGQIGFVCGETAWSHRRIAYPLLMDVDARYATDVGRRIRTVDGAANGSAATDIRALRTTIAGCEKDVRAGAGEGADDDVERVRGIVDVVGWRRHVGGGIENSPAVRDDERLEGREEISVNDEIEHVPIGANRVAEQIRQRRRMQDGNVDEGGVGCADLDVERAHRAVVRGHSSGRYGRTERKAPRGVKID